MKVFFPNLNGLRAIGAFTVVFGHIELTKREFGLPNLIETFNFFKFTSGHLGVMLFFTLSGFLITYLLFVEKTNFNTINIKEFYIRRALRIWPIYYLMVFFVLFLFPFIVSEYPGRLSIGEDRFWPIFLIYILLVPNLSSIGIGGAGGIFHLGTIGTEEQFYWIWPFLIKFFKWIGAILLFIFLFITLLPFLVDYTRIHLANQDWQVKFLTQLGLFLPNFKINSMALGGMAAYVHFYKKEKILAFLFHPIIQVIAILVGFGGWILGVHFSYFSDEFYSVWFAITILNLATNPKTIFHLNFSILEYLGKISYGIYTFHWVIILLVIYLLKPISFFQDLKIIPLNLILYPLITGLTLLVSHFSFFYFEKYFLNWKKTFSKISM